MILNDKHDTAVRVSDVRNMRRLTYGPDSTNPRYCIELRYKHAAGSTEDSYGPDKDARDTDFAKMNRAMDTLDGIQQ